MTQRVRRALLSVSDKTGLENFARQLNQLGVELISTGGTHRLLAEAGVPVTEISAHTGFPEMMDGRVKTLHPAVHGALLAVREDPEGHQAVAARRTTSTPIDLVVHQPLPVRADDPPRRASRRAEAIEQIDIGGPSMVRSAAKNHRHVGIVTDPADYDRVLERAARRRAAHLDSTGCARELAPQGVRADGGATTRRSASGCSLRTRRPDAEGSRFPTSYLRLAGTKA